MIDDIFVLLGAALILFGSAGYLRDTLKGRIGAVIANRRQSVEELSQ